MTKPIEQTSPAELGVYDFYDFLYRPPKAGRFPQSTVFAELLAYTSYYTEATHGAAY